MKKISYFILPVVMMFGMQTRAADQFDVARIYAMAGGALGAYTVAKAAHLSGKVWKTKYPYLAGVPAMYVVAVGLITKSILYDDNNNPLHYLCLGMLAGTMAAADVNDLAKSLGVQQPGAQQSNA